MNPSGLPTSTDMLDMAFRLGDMGISYVPLVGKHPLSGLPLKEYARRRPTLGETFAWFGEVSMRSVRKNIGVVCGPISGIVGIDGDTDEAFAALQQRLPATDMRTKTSRGGHLYFRLREGQIVRPHVQARIAGVEADIRGSVSYLVGPRSLHPRGGLYEMLGEWNLAKVPYFDECWIEDRPVHISVPGRKIVASLQPGALPIRDLMAYCLKIPSRQGENGSKGCFRVACLCRDQGYTPEQAFAFMQEWQERSDQVQPKWSDQELWHKINDAFAREG